MRYRVDQLAASCDVSVDTVRYYQSLGLVPPPEKEGRVAWYGAEHVARIREVRSLQRKGLRLAAIQRVVTGELGAPDADLAAAVAAAMDERRDAGEGELMTLEEFSARSGVPASLIQAVEREGIRLGRRTGDGDRYATGDIRIVRTALRLLDFGLPIGDLLTLARESDQALRGLATRAVDLFDEHVRKPIRDSSQNERDAAAGMVEAFGELLPAVVELVATYFRRVVLEVAEQRIEAPDDAA